MKKVKPFIKYIPFEIFAGGIGFVVGYNHKEATAEIDRMLKAKEWTNKDFKLAWKDVELDYDATAGQLSERSIQVNGKHKYYIYFLWQKEFSFKDERDYITLAHELIHLNQHLLHKHADREIEHEFEAYFHSYMMRKCLEALRENRK